MDPVVSPEEATGVTDATQGGIRVAFDRKNYDKTRYKTIYAQYIDADLTPSEGRRIGKAHAVKNPHIQEVVLAAYELGYRDFFVERRKSLPCLQGSEKFPIVPRDCLKIALTEPEDKHYIKKSEFDHQTRAPLIDDIPNKQVFLKRVAAIIKGRVGERPPHPSVAEIIAAVPGGQPQPKKKGGK